MTPAFTILLPHKRNPGNDTALSICLDCIARNTANEYALIMDAAFDEPLYPRINRMLEYAYTDTIIYLASDIFVAPNWDAALYEAWDLNTIVTGVVVEPGAIAMHPMNYHRDFGRKPETFRRGAFENWAVSNEAPLLEGEGWPCAYMASASGLLDLGGFETNLIPDDMGFTKADTILWERWKAAGNTIRRARSFVYHLQRYSDESEQGHEKRG